MTDSKSIRDCLRIAKLARSIEDACNIALYAAL